MIAATTKDKRSGEYRRLLLSDWKRDFPEEVLALLWEALGNHLTVGEDDPLLPLLDPDSEASFPGELFASLVRRIAQATRFIRLVQLPEVPPKHQLPRRPSKSIWAAARLSTYLTLQAQADLSGNLDFFRDVQALAFQAAIHQVLPDLNGKHAAEASILLHAMVLFALEYAAVDPSHFSYLLSVLHGYLGNRDERLRYLQAAFRFTEPADHSFLTKAQEYWTELLDCEQFDEAERFLISLPLFGLPFHQEEIKEMVVAGFKYIVANGRNKSQPTK